MFSEEELIEVVIGVDICESVVEMFGVFIVGGVFEEGGFYYVCSCVCIFGLCCF